MDTCNHATHARGTHARERDVAHHGVYVVGHVREAREDEVVRNSRYNRLAGTVDARPRVPFGGTVGFTIVAASGRFAPLKSVTA